MGTFVGILFVLICIGLVNHSNVIQEEKAVAQVYNDLRDRGFSSIGIERVQVVGGQAFTFKVSYRNRQDVYCAVVCQVQSGVEDAPVFWQEPIPASLFGGKGVGGETAVSLPTPPATTKEQIISDLFAKNERLQAEVEYLRQHGESL